LRKTKVGMSYVLLILSLKKIVIFQTPVVGLRSPVVGLSPALPAHGDATRRDKQDFSGFETVSQDSITYCFKQLCCTDICK
jgi:hypothetical protein